MHIEIESTDIQPNEPIAHYIADRSKRIFEVYHFIDRVHIHFMQIKEADELCSKMVAMELHLPGKKLSAETYADTYYRAANQSIENLQQELKSYQERFQEVL